MINEAFTLENPFDFNAFSVEFPGLCGDRWHYAHVIGTSAVAMTIFPGHTPDQAYLLALWDMGVERALSMGQPPPERPVFEIEDAAPPDPTFTDMAKSAGLSVTKWVSAGSPVLAADERAIRLALCKTCPEMINSRCRRCGCFLAIKSWMRTEQCPKGKW